ncbi:MAG: alpha/beta fold hydrolase, partial [Streptosporangiaceae bacterium]
QQDWAGHRAAAPIAGTDGGAFLNGGAARGAYCDAMVTPVGSRPPRPGRPCGPSYAIGCAGPRPGGQSPGVRALEENGKIRPGPALARIAAMDRTRQVAKAADGRTLVFAEWGDLSGRPVFSMHGMPGCRLNRRRNADLFRSTGAREICYDRPGYGGSDRHRGRTVADAASDVAAIADHLGIERFSVYGASGGGPHALAVAALLGDRVIRAICIGSVAPFDALGEDFFSGTDPENIKGWKWAAEGEERLAAELEREDREYRRQVAIDPGGILEKYDLAESDREALRRAEVAEIIRETAAEQTRNGIWGWVDDGLALVSPWGFDPATIRVPTRVWYGTQDVLVPPGHGEWIASTVPGATVRLNELGHIGNPDADLAECLTWLTQEHA